MGYWLVTELKFVTNRTSYITGQKRAARQHQAQTKQLNTVLLWMVKRLTTTPVDLEIVPLSPRGF